MTVDTCALAAERVLDSLGATVASLLPPSKPTSATCDIFQTLSALLTHFILEVPPLICAPRTKQTAPDSLDALVGRLVTSVLTPLVSSFYQLSLAYLSSLFLSGTTAKATNRSKKVHYDIRPGALNLLRCALDALQQLATTSSGKPVLVASAQSVHEVVLFSALRQLDELYPLTPSVEDEHEACAMGLPPDVGGAPPKFSQLTTPQLPHQAHKATDKGCPTTKQSEKSAPGAQQRAQALPERTDRIAKLARKDALWYLCSVLHCAIPGTTLGSTIPGPQAGPSSETAAPHQLLRDAACTVLAALLRRTAPSAKFHVRRPLECRDGDELDHDDLAGLEDKARGCTASVQLRMAMVRGRGLLSNVEREMLLAVAEKLWLTQG